MESKQFVYAFMKAEGSARSGLNNGSKMALKPTKAGTVDLTDIAALQDQYGY